MRARILSRFFFSCVRFTSLNGDLTLAANDIRYPVKIPARGSYQTFPQQIRFSHRMHVRRYWQHGYKATDDLAKWFSHDPSKPGQCRVDDKPGRRISDR